MTARLQVQGLLCKYFQQKTGVNEVISHQLNKLDILLSHLTNLKDIKGNESANCAIST